MTDDDDTYGTSSDLSVPPPAPHSFSFIGPQQRVWLTITNDGKMEIGDGLSEDEATSRVAKMLVDKFGAEIGGEIDRLKTQLALLGGAASWVVLSGEVGKLLDVLKACDALHDLPAYRMMMEAIDRARDDPA